MPGFNGPSIRAVVRVINQNSCGSGSIVGHYNGGSLVLTNAHVAGTQIGRVVKLEVESLGMLKLSAKVIRAAYSNQVIADWALLFVEAWQAIAPVKLSKNPPASGESLYTRGFPRCQKHNGTDITQHKTLNNGVILWQPDAIGGQSGSGVWGDDDNLQKALLTWSWTDGGRSYGAGQLTSEIYRQNRDSEVRGFPMMPGLQPLNEFDFGGVDRIGAGDPYLLEGFHSIPMPRGIQEFPIWAEDDVPPPDDPPPTDPGTGDAWRLKALDSIRKIEDAAASERKKFEKQISQPIDSGNSGGIHDTFGL